MDKITVTMEDGFITTARNEGGLEVHADLPPDSGADSAINPEEMLLAALGSCMAQTAKLYANRKGWVIDKVEISLEVERFNAKDYADYDGDERFVHEIREHIVFHGDLDDEQKARLLEITGKCPVRRVISTPTIFKELRPATS